MNKLETQPAGNEANMRLNLINMERGIQYLIVLGDMYMRGNF